jgi:plasmid stability protein
MAQALIRKIKDETLADYRSAAAAKGRSLEAELRDLIERNRPAREKDSAALMALSERLRAGTPASAASVDSTEYIRWARDTDAGRYLGGGSDDAGR